ncbi:hypothetical protein Sjap_024896 [Stephania japonica]|uniref:Uncharacterized protein n=1 Tax=Stephania japonica TaxID=461633 RepID=A0AAP0EMW2_9MAGN
MPQYKGDRPSPKYEGGPSLNKLERRIVEEFLEFATRYDVSPVRVEVLTLKLKGHAINEDSDHVLLNALAVAPVPFDREPEMENHNTPYDGAVNQSGSPNIRHDERHSDGRPDVGAGNEDIDDYNSDPDRGWGSTRSSEWKT